MRDDTRVLLIGGSSGVGKTVIAPQLAARLGMPWGSADDFRLVLERMTTLDAQPVLHTFFRTLWQRSAEELATTYIEVAQIVSYALEIVIANHVATRAPVILEGDTILPALAAKRVVANRPVGNHVRAIFLVESDEAAIQQNMLQRDRGVAPLSGEQLQIQVRFRWLYGQWLEREAHRCGIPIIPPQPRETLATRILEIVQRTDHLTDSIKPALAACSAAS